MTDRTRSVPHPFAEFGANEWLVDEIYQRYLDDPQSVDPAWWDFFADYVPRDRQRAATGRAEADGVPSGAGTAGPVREREPAVRAAPLPPSAANGGTPAPAAPPPPSAGHEAALLKGPAARTASNMTASLTIPTATSVRDIPAKLLVDNRLVMNNHLRRGRGGKISFTHIIGYAVVKAAAAHPEMNAAYTEIDGKPAVIRYPDVNLGLAIDLAKDDGSRQLLVPCIKGAQRMDFAQFWAAYEDLVRRARAGTLTVDDFSGTTITLTNPGTIGTVHSVPRLMPGQGCIVGVGAMEYPAQFQGASEETLANLAVSKVLTLTSTYDHRIIQGAQSGEFLRHIHRLLLGEEGFYDELFRALRIPYEPVRWVKDIVATHADEVGKQARIVELIHAYRVRGHLMADTNPLEFEMRRHPDLDIVNHGLTLWDLDRRFATGGFAGESVMRLRDILGVLRDSYCRTVGIEYMHIQDPEQRRWIQERVEKPQQRLEREEQLYILNRLNVAEAFETFLQTKYVGQRRFSLEGAETLIPLLDTILDAAAHQGLDEVVIGMAHRGRLNVLANIVGKSYAQIFREFEGYLDPASTHGSGDVKYHLGAEGSYLTRDRTKQIKVSLVSNPSHLEAVDPVLEGIVRAKQDVLNKGKEFPVLALAIHGDAAFAGQGVVAETLNLSQLRGYRTGGTIHVVINNQVGFTTSPAAARSSVYATDVARMIQAPIFHVNGDDPEAAVRVARLALEFRQAFNKDVVIDLVCYRRRGHNEADDPSMTQPLMYDLIDAKRSVRKLYTEALIGRGDITIDEAEAALRDYRARLEEAFAQTRDSAPPPERAEAMPPSPPSPSHVDTAIPIATLKRIAESQVNLPEGFTPHPRLAPLLQRRAAMVDTDAIDWPMAELIAFGSLLLEGHPVRLAGQDSRRGTFVQRHAVLIDRKTAAEYVPLAHLDPHQAPFYVYDSLLSEFAALGFEYGYSVARPEALVAWEAQFGDFANGAQTIIDEFIVAGEQKWGQRSGLVLLLPHGYEGQGPDHSSGRIERFLQLCAQQNMTVAMPSCAASYFHLLRWQIHSGVRRPLVVFTPKSMLRARAAASPASAFTAGSWAPVLGDPDPRDPAEVTRVLLASGKVVWELVERRAAQQRRDTAIVRVEQLYPVPVDDVRSALAAFPRAEEYVWVQEEPENMGAWSYFALHLAPQLDKPLQHVARPESSAPATGSHVRSEREREELLAAALPSL
ncbi:MAG: multifunctional oxoglutarate decarboxylase/oxoglutarate dehydrogenase thiamine pyrophosphate-binding subunit/dihydrolipoyllysine-residue succinyltransferase subunit [Acidothermus sp.]|nr:multifunctional oxoglutarate decarboxylase/oxoglutarate dehydrogenase thiamine pyrophosphate-binding subunit/dihydrolipoyllysine-residue succinyltransferase subunit [Acidothermus sp.]